MLGINSKLFPTNCHVFCRVFFFALKLFFSMTHRAATKEDYPQQKMYSIDNLFKCMNPLHVYVFPFFYPLFPGGKDRNTYYTTSQPLSEETRVGGWVTHVTMKWETSVCIFSHQSQCCFLLNMMFPNLNQVVLLTMTTIDA